MRTTERTLGSDGLRRHSFYGRRDVLSTSLALNDDMFRAFWSREHRNQHRRTKNKNLYSYCPWKLVDFHAYRGYGFTHKQGIEGDQIRITGVSFTHNRGTKSS